MIERFVIVTCKTVEAKPTTAQIWFDALTMEAKNKN